MKSWIYPGAKVVAKVTAPYVPNANLVVRGGIYTIDTINDWPIQGVILTFKELDNSHMIGPGDEYEPGFAAWGFRPLNPDEHRRTSDTVARIKRDALDSARKPVTEGV